MLEVKAKVPKAGGVEVAALVDLGDNLADATARFGEEVVFSNYQASVKITVQSRMRALKEKGKTDEEIQAELANFKPGVSAERTVDPIAMIMGKAGKMSEEEVLALITKIKAAKGIE
ncbi:MAG: hypothetical protein WC455_21330 [Dehalococcoidia bacterium]|jgi:hypothetical protein